MSLAATLKQAGLKLDVSVANEYIGRWLTEMANARVHAANPGQQGMVASGPLDSHGYHL